MDLRLPQNPISGNEEFVEKLLALLLFNGLGLAHIQR